jgi:signal-transduction protein with cAMP-binding, CBS, and nucleotidyltransferase domain
MVLEITSRMFVREAMSSPVISVHEDASVVELADTMKAQKVGAIIVVNKQDKPVGIVTERDIVTRVVAEGRTPQALIAKEIMSSPLRMVEPEMKLMDALSLMDKLNIRRLGVTYKGDLVGVVSDKDIIRLVPTIVEIMKEQREISNLATVSGPSVAGYCDRCEIYSNNLRSVDGEFLCEDCRAEE